MTFKDILLLIEQDDSTDDDILSGMEEVDKMVSPVYIIRVYPTDRYVHISENVLTLMSLLVDYHPVLISKYDVIHTLKNTGRWYYNDVDAHFLFTLSREDADKFINHWVNVAKTSNIELYLINEKDKI